MTFAINEVPNASNRLPIVLCLDISPSMTLENRMKNLNDALRLFFSELKTDKKVYNAAEITFVTFSTDVYADKNFLTLDEAEKRTFTPVKEGGSQISKAVLKSIEILEERLSVYDDSDIDYYMPFLVLVTDGDPDSTDNTVTRDRAIASIHRHCELSGSQGNLIAPYIIGVGNDVTRGTLDKMAEKFTGEAIIVNGDVSKQGQTFKELFAFISKSVKNSLKGADDLKGLYAKMKKQASGKIIEIKEKNRGVM